MLAVIGFVLVSTVASALLLRFAGGAPPESELPWDLTDNARKQMTIQASMAGYAVTASVLLITFARDRADIATDEFNATVAMLLGAYISYVGTALMWANLARPAASEDAFDLQRLQYSLVTLQSFRVVFVGWFALRPLLGTFALTTLAELAGAALLVLLLGGWANSSAPLYRLGYLSRRALFLLPVLSLGGAFLFALAVAVLAPQLRAPQSALYLTGAFLFVNLATFGLFTSLPVWELEMRPILWLVRHWQALCTAHTAVSVVLIAFYWLAVVGLL